MDRIKRSLTARGTVAVCVAVVAALAAGGGYAAASSGSRTINACVKKGSRTLYKSPCKKHDKKISWSQAGPPGPAGATGATGAAGATGPRGPSNGYSAFNSSGVALNDVSFTTVQTLTVPAGQYMVFAKFEPYMSVSGAEGFRCDLLDPSQSRVDYDTTSVDNPTVPFVVTSLVGAVSTPGGVISLDCMDELTNSGQILYPHLAAIALDSVSGATPFASVKPPASARGARLTP